MPQKKKGTSTVLNNTIATKNVSDDIIITAPSPSSSPPPPRQMKWDILNETTMEGMVSQQEGDQQEKGCGGGGIRSDDLRMELEMLAAIYQDDASCTVLIGAAQGGGGGVISGDYGHHASAVSTVSKGKGSKKAARGGYGSSHDTQSQILGTATEAHRARVLSENSIWNRHSIRVSTTTVKSKIDESPAAAATTPTDTNGTMAKVNGGSGGGASSSSLSYVVTDAVLLQVDFSFQVKTACTSRGSLRILISADGYSHGDESLTPFVQCRMYIPAAEEDFEDQVQATLDSLCGDALDGQQMILLALVGAVSEAMHSVPITTSSGSWGVCMRCSQHNIRMGLPKVAGVVLPEPVMVVDEKLMEGPGGCAKGLALDWRCVECDSTDVVHLPSLKTVPVDKMESSPCSFCLCEERALIEIDCGDRSCVSCFVRMCDMAIGSQELFKPCRDEMVRSSWCMMREKGKEEDGGLLPPVDYPFTPEQPARLLKRGVTVVCPNHKGCVSGLITDLSLFKLLPLRTMARYNAFALQHSLLHESQQAPKRDSFGDVTDDGLASPYGVRFATRCPLLGCHGSVYTSSQYKGMMVCPYCLDSYCHRCMTPAAECTCGEADAHNGPAFGMIKCPSEAIKHLGLPLAEEGQWAAALASRGAAASNMGVFEAFFYTVPPDLNILNIRLPQYLKGTSTVRALDRKRVFKEVETSFKKAVAGATLGRKFTSEEGAVVVDVATGKDGGLSSSDPANSAAMTVFRSISNDSVLVLHWCIALIRKRSKEALKLTHHKAKWKTIRVNSPILAAVQLVERLTGADDHCLRRGSILVREAALQRCWEYLQEYSSKRKQKPQELTRVNYIRLFSSNFTRTEIIMHLVRMCFRTTAVVVIFRGISFTVHLPTDLPAHCNVSTNLFLQAISNGCPSSNTRTASPFTLESFIVDPDRSVPPADLCPYAHLLWSLVRAFETQEKPDSRHPVSVSVGWADILELAVSDTLGSGSSVGDSRASPLAGRWGVSSTRSMFVTAGAALSTTPVVADIPKFGSFSTALSAPVHANIIHPGSTIFVVEHFAKDRHYCNTFMDKVRDVQLAQVSKSKASEGMSTITRRCPGCYAPTVHYLGHGCHIMTCGSRRCGIDWCYACGLIAPGHHCPSKCTLFCQYEIAYKRRDDGVKSDAVEEEGIEGVNRNNNNEAETIERQIQTGKLVFSHIYGGSCGCTLCPDCRPHMPCSICSGCPVCTGVGIGTMARHIVADNDDQGEEGEDDDDDEEEESFTDDSSFDSSDDDMMSEGDFLIFDL